MEEGLQDVMHVQKQFCEDVLPEMEKELAEAQKDYHRAEAAMKKSQGALSAMAFGKSDSATTLLNDFSAFQEALAKVRFLQSGLVVAIDSLLRQAEIAPRAQALLRSAIRANQESVSELLSQVAVSGKSIDATTEHFKRRFCALSQQEQARIPDLLGNPSHRGPLPAGVTMTQDLFPRARKFGLMLSVEAAMQDLPVDHPVRGKVAEKAQYTRDHFPLDEDISARDVYQRSFTTEHREEIRAYAAEWERREAALRAELEKEPSVSRQRKLGLFFLALHAGTWIQSIHHMRQESAALPGRAAKAQADLIAMAGKDVEREAGFIGSMLSDKLDDLRTMSQAHVKTLREGAKRGWSPKQIGEVMNARGTQATDYSTKFFVGDDPKASREERWTKVSGTIDGYFAAKDKVTS